MRARIRPAANPRITARAIGPQFSPLPPSPKAGGAIPRMVVSAVIRTAPRPHAPRFFNRLKQSSPLSPQLVDVVSRHDTIEH